jgi:hypothetical protein
MIGSAARVRLVALAACLLAACGSPPQQLVSSNRFNLIEHMQVVGSCSEDQAGESARYVGYVDRWHDVQKNRELVQGSVTAVDRFAEAPGKRTRAPYSIQFGDVGPPKIEGSRLVLKGLTDGSRPADATCALDITQRDRPRGPSRFPITARNVLSVAALAIGLVAGIRLVRLQARRTIAPLLLALALLLQLLSILLP